VSLKNRKSVYSITSLTATIILVIAVFFLVTYLIAPLFGGKLFVDAIIKCASWAGIGLAIKIVLKRAQNGEHIRACDYLLLCLVFIANLVVWFPYPANLILSILGVIGFIFSYRLQKSRS
jgi:steroid 5-alpha reductase family enzyme